MEQVKKYIAHDGSMRASVVDCSRLASAICQYNGCFPAATTFLGRSVIAAVLLSAQLKEDLWIQLNFEGSGPLQKVWTRGWHDGRVFGFCKKPQADAPLRDGKLDVSASIGIGLLHVDVATSLGQPYRGTVHIVSGEVGDDVAYYLYQSQQIPSIVSIGLHIDPKTALIDAAGGILIELLPGHTEDQIQNLEKNLQTARTASNILLSGDGELGFIKDYLKGVDMVSMKHDAILSVDQKFMKPGSEIYQD